MQLLARRRGIISLLYLFFRGVSSGDPIYIGIAVVLVLGIIGYVMYKRHVNFNESDVADYVQDFQPPETDPNKQ